MDKLPAHDFCRLQNWYASLANHTFVSTFVKMRPEEIQALQNGESTGTAANDIISRLAEPMKAMRGNCFVSVDLAAPTDTERFAGKRGAVYSARSAWRYLCESDKIRHAAASGEATSICIRPFRSMNQTREFRLFINDRKLKAMSQYYLIRHFRRLEGAKQKYWELARDFVNRVSWLLPVDNIVMDIYISSADEILIIDLNPWGEPTSPLLFKNWNIDWSVPYGLKLIPPPTRISGNVNVSF